MRAQYEIIFKINGGGWRNLGRITLQSTAGDVEDFILFHKYLSFDKNYGEEVERFLMEAGDIVERIPNSDTVPKELIQKLLALVGDEYDG